MGGAGLSFAPDGTLYAVGFEISMGAALFTVDLDTGMGNVVGALGKQTNILLRTLSVALHL